MKVKYEIGDIVTNVHGTSVKVIKAAKRSKILIKGIDYDFEKSVTVKSLQKSSFTTPFCKTVYGVGYFGVGPYKCRGEDEKITKVYCAWANMIKRCYTEYLGNRSKHCYVEAFVCDDWLNFQFFAKWYTKATEKFYANGIIPKIDKDLFAKNDRGTMYSPETICVVPNIINCALVQIRTTNTVHNGVVEKKPGIFVCSVMHKYKGYRKKFSSKESAIAYYLETKQKFLFDLAEEYKYILCEKTYNALVNWKWRTNEVQAIRRS